MLYADTSFLFSLVLHDANTAAAVAHLKAGAARLAFTPWQRCELRNAIRLALWRQSIVAAQARRALARSDDAIGSGDLVETAIVWPQVMATADELSDRHTAAIGVRTLDLIHVAVAISLGSRSFLTFDTRQIELARAAGLRATVPVGKA